MATEAEKQTILREHLSKIGKTKNPRKGFGSKSKEELQEIAKKTWAKRKARP